MMRRCGQIRCSRSYRLQDPSGKVPGYDVRGLAIIWGSPQKLPELSPVSYTVLLIEHQFFGLSPRGYHIISILLQARNALLLWLLLRRLELPGAWLGAALFALHPVQVDAVSWISQQRYLVCGAFYLCPRCWFISGARD